MRRRLKKVLSNRTKMLTFKLSEKELRDFKDLSSDLNLTQVGTFVKLLYSLKESVNVVPDSEKVPDSLHWDDLKGFNGKGSHCTYCHLELERSHYNEGSEFKYSFCSSAHEELHKRGYSYCLMCQDKYSVILEGPILQGTNKWKQDYSPFCSKGCRSIYNKLPTPLKRTKHTLYQRIESRLLKATLSSLDPFIDSVCEDIASTIKGESD